MTTEFDGWNPGSIYSIPHKGKWIVTDDFVNGDLICTNLHDKTKTMTLDEVQAQGTFTHSGKTL